jgi:hypothetical protein
MDSISIRPVVLTQIGGHSPCEPFDTSEPLKGISGNPFVLTKGLPIRDLKEIISQKLQLVAEFFLVVNGKILQVGFTVGDYVMESGEVKVYIIRTGSDRAHS